MQLPDEKRCCHHTGFSKSCRKFVTSGACRRWVDLSFQNVKTGQVAEHYGCIDDMNFPLNQLALKKQDETTASIDELRNESKQREETAMAVQARVLGSMLDVGQRLELAADQTEVPQLPSPRNN
jgi:hypothetical protein